MVRGYKIQIISGKTEIDESADIHIINYDIAMKKSEFLHSKKWQVIICDESHYLKNASAQRTKAILGEKGKGAIRSERKWFLTGTPLLNRPIELFAPLRYLMPLGFTNKEKFSVKYCAAGFDHMGYWDDKGASNTDELNTLLHEYIMLRRAKSDVLTDLPDKTRQVIELEPCGASKAESKILKGIDGDFRNVMSQVKGKFFGGSDHMMTIRRKTGLAKFKPACEVIDSYIESGEKLVVFAVHTELIQKLYDKYKEQAVILTGGTSMKERDRAVRAFQNEPDVKIFIGNIQAAGVGITLTAASNALMLELPWSPSEVIQAEDRLHRLTQENAVLIKYLVFPDTIDSLLTRMLSSKTKVIREILD
jgi:SWI/SNF-related matrix-associated actin-dependent regulator 1 of chromatin subfamily A